MQAALRILDRFILDALNASVPASAAAASARPAAVNAQLARFVSQQPSAGEDYRLARLGGSPPVYALAANFGSSGPSAVRIYAPMSENSRYALVAQIDRFSHKDYFDDYLQILPADETDLVFLTVTGRTDELQSGMFSAWRLDGRKVVLLWSSDLLPQSSYELRDGTLDLRYCAESSEENHRTCLRRLRERYRWDGAHWVRTERLEVPLSDH